MKTYKLSSLLMRHVAVAHLFMFVVVACAQSTATGHGGAASWQGLLKNGKCLEARMLCEGWVSSTDPYKRAEGHKCLANVVLCGTQTMTIQAADTGDGYIGESYKAEAVEDALVHLNEAMKLMPQDLSIHKGRLHLLSVGARFGEMPKALEESLHIYKGSTADTWIAYSYELFQVQQYRSGIDLLKVLEKSFPNDHEVIGNLGAMYSMLKDDEKAIPYLLRAVELAPNDPIDTWNLGRIYDYTGKTDLAGKWYTKSLSIDDDAERKKTNSCLYAEFLIKAKEPEHACEIQKKNECKQTACKQVDEATMR